MTATSEPWAQLDALPRKPRWQLELSRRERLIAASHPALQAAETFLLPLAADQFVIRPAAHAVGEHAGPGRRRRAANRDRRLPLVHRLGPRHHDQPGGADARHRAASTRRATSSAPSRTHVRDGLIPNLFPEGAQRGAVPHRRRHAVVLPRAAPLRHVTGDRDTLHGCCPTLEEIVAAPPARARASGSASTRRRPADARAHDGYQLTWMDAKVDDWVVTPRRGKAGRDQRALVQRAAAAGALAGREGEGDGGRPRHRARCRARAATRSTRGSGTRRGGYLYDVVDGERGDDDRVPAEPAASRSSLPHPVLEARAGSRCCTACASELLTPVGLRSLAPGDPDYKPRYFGDLRARDAAYHQGTVWAWLIGPFVDAWLQVYPGRPRRARAAARRPGHHLGEACVGIDQRNLRRRAAVHAAGLHRAGVERRGAVAGAGPSGGSRIENGSQEG